MTERDNFLEIINRVYDDSRYPDGFLSEYTIMECLSDRQGSETFLVQRKDKKAFVAKCFDKSVYAVHSDHDILKDIDHPGLPRQVASFENEAMLVTVREYIEGVTLARYAKENSLTEGEITGICVKLCDILRFLHDRDEPIIHRDIKPQNIIVGPDGELALIDFDIARIYRSGNDMDTSFFGTLVYAPPEQYGFSQTDVRSDIYSLGVVLRYLLTGSAKPNPNIRVSKPLQKIIDRCTAFAPKDRFSSAGQVKKALLASSPRRQRLRHIALALGALALAAALVLGGVRLYRYLTCDPFASGTPGYLSDETMIAEAVATLNEAHRTTLFEASDDVATVGYLRRILIEVYGLDRDYVYGVNDGNPQESDAFFLPWGWDDAQTVDRDPTVYMAVKLFDSALVADWSSLRNDNGYYPGMRVAVAFAEKTGILNGVNRPRDTTLGEVALIFANAEKVFEAG